MAIEDIFKEVKSASRSILKLGVDRINEIILAVSDEVVNEVFSKFCVGK